MPGQAAKRARLPEEPGRERTRSAEHCAMDLSGDLVSHWNIAALHEVALGVIAQVL